MAIAAKEGDAKKVIDLIFHLSTLTNELTNLLTAAAKFLGRNLKNV